MRRPERREVRRVNVRRDGSIEEKRQQKKT